MIRQIFISLTIVFLTLTLACRRDKLNVDISDIEYQLDIKRFDSELFELDPDSLDTALDRFYEEYGDFFDVFNVHILNIGHASQRFYSSYLSMFINDPLNREVYEYANEVFAEITEIEQSIEDGLKRYLYHYPDSLPPYIVFYSSRFNQGLFTVGNYIGVGIDHYLGRDCEYYDQLGISEFLQYNKYPGKIPADIMYTLTTKLYPYNDSVDNVLNRMIHAGMQYYFVEAMLPTTEDSILIGFSPDQLKWCLNNEKQMWAYLVEHKLLFSSDDLDIRKLTDNAPYTQFFTSESPGRAAVWQGWQIVRSFVKRHPEMDLSEIMSIHDYQNILNGSRYSP